MKVKKDELKMKKKRTKTQPVTANSAIKKAKKTEKIKKIRNNSHVAAVVKKECEESARKGTQRQQIWNEYLKTFYEIEKLNQKQKQIMEFCTNKSLTPPKRKGRFLNFIRNCFVNQAEMTDEQINELFDLLLKKYDEYKLGTYRISDPSHSDSISETKSNSKLSKNKRKKLIRANSISSTTVKKQLEPDLNEEKWEVTKLKKRKRAKTSKVEIANQDEEMNE